MGLRDHLDKDWILVNVRSADKGALLELLADAVADRLQGVAREDLLDRLRDREAQCSTGIGHGVAVPHIVIEGVDQIRCALVQIPAGVDYAAVDGAAVTFAFLLVGPPTAIGGHLKLLARIARLIRRADFVRELSQAKSAAEIHALVVQEDEGRGG